MIDLPKRIENIFNIIDSSLFELVSLIKYYKLSPYKFKEHLRKNVDILNNKNDGYSVELSSDSNLKHTLIVNMGDIYMVLYMRFVYDTRWSLKYDDIVLSDKNGVVIEKISDINDNYDIENMIKQELIDKWFINNPEVIIRNIDGISDKDIIRLKRLFIGYNKYTMLYDDIDYDKIKPGTIVRSNILNVSDNINEYKIVSITNGHLYKIDYNDYTIITVNIKQVVSY